MRERNLKNKMGLDDDNFSDLCRSVHDIMMNFGYEGDESPSDYEVLMTIGMLDDDTLNDIEKWGASDTVLGDKMYEEIEKIFLLFKTFGDIYSPQKENKSYDWGSELFTTQRMKGHIMKKTGLHSNELMVLFDIVKNEMVKLQRNEVSDHNVYEEIEKFPFIIIALVKRYMRVDNNFLGLLLVQLKEHFSE